MIKKLSTLLLTLLLLVTNISFVLAEDNIEDNPEDPNTQETEKSNNNNYDKSIEYLDNKVNSQQNQINELNRNINNLRSNPANNGYLTNFNKLSTNQLDWYYNNYQNLASVNLINNLIYFAYKSDINSITYNSNNIYMNCINSYTCDINGNITNRNSSINFRFYSDNISDDENYSNGFLLFYTDKYEYLLTPYKLTISDNSNISINPNSIPYDSLIFYSGQAITLIYNDQLHDFTGWYDINGNLVSNQLEYTFNINQDITIQVNYNTDHSSNINYDYFIYIILLLSLIFLNDITKGVFNS